MQPALDPSALQYIYTEQLVVFQDERDFLLREAEFENTSVLEVGDFETKPQEEVKVEEVPIVVHPTMPSPELPSKTSLITHGQNKRAILILLPGNKTDLKPEERDFLLKILAAKSLKGSDVCFAFEAENQQITKFQELLIVKPQLIIGFGVAGNLNALLPTTKYNLITKSDILLLNSDSLFKLANDGSLKKSLWSQLQPLVLA